MVTSYYSQNNHFNHKMITSYLLSGLLIASMSGDVDFLFAMSEDELDHVSSYSITSFTSEEDNKSSISE